MSEFGQNDDALGTVVSVLKREEAGISQLRGSLKEQEEAITKIVEMINKCQGKLIVSGIGKSGHVGKKLAASFASLGTSSLFVHPGESAHGDRGMIESQDLVILITNSGETSEVLNLIPYLKSIEVPIISITGGLDCRLARKADVALTTGVQREADPWDLAPTTSSTVTLALGDAIAIAVARLQGFTEEDFFKFHPGGALGEQLIADSD